MAYVPYIKDYKPFYIQNAAGECYDTAAQWGMVAKSNPYPMLPEPKAPYFTDWKDVSGDDEYVESMAYESQEISVTFYVIVYGGTTSEAVLRDQIWEFFKFVKSGYMYIYDSYTGYGRSKVRYAGYTEESDGFRRTSEYARAIFTVKFKVNEPTVECVYENGKIIVYDAVSSASLNTVEE